MSSNKPVSFFERGGVWVIAQFILMPACFVCTPLGNTSTASMPVRIAAWGLIVSGAVAGITGVWALKKNRTPFPKPLPGMKLVRHGVYRVIRHPLYASLIFLAFGWACLWISPWGFVLAAAQAALLEAKAGREERWLKEKFPEYSAYAAQVKRFIPFVY